MHGMWPRMRHSVLARHLLTPQYIEKFLWYKSEKRNSSQNCCLCWKSGGFSFANTAAHLFLLQFCFLQFLSPVQMVEVADGHGKVRLSRTAVASLHTCYDPECLSFLCLGLFGLGYLNSVFIGKTRRKGGLASWQIKLKTERKESWQSHLYWFLIWGWRFFGYVQGMEER